MPAAGLSEAQLLGDSDNSQYKAGCSMLGLPLPLVDHSACLLQGCQAPGQHETAMPRRVGRWLQGVRGCQSRCSAGVPASCRAVSSGLLYFVANRASEASHPVGLGCRLSEVVDGGAQSVHCLLQGCQAPRWLTTAASHRMVPLALLSLLAMQRSRQQMLLGCRQQQLGPHWMLQHSRGRPQLALLPYVSLRRAKNVLPEASMYYFLNV